MSVALIDVAPSITWLLVSTSPDEVTTMPVPAACAPWSPSVDTMSTRPGSTLVAIWDVVRAVVDAPGAPVDPAWAKWYPDPPITRPAAATAAVTARRRPRPCLARAGGTSPGPPPGP